jgi:CelD/BcsL family acetyltransferase involved in cellulose biosynthesis
MKIAVSSRLADFADVWPSLNQQGRHCAYAFQTREVLEVWLDTIGIARKTQPLFVRVDSDDGAPLMLAPLGVERRRGLRILGFLDGGVCDYNAPVLFPGAESIDAEAFGRLWNSIAEKLPQFDAALFDKIPTAVDEMRNPFKALAPTSDFNSGHLVRLDGAEEGGDAAPSPRFSNTDRKWRKLRSAGKVEFLIADAPADAARIYEAMVRQKTRRYLDTRGVDGFDRPGYRGYYRVMTDRFLSSGGVQLSALLLDGAPIATQWAVITPDRFYSLMPAFEVGPSARHSPGLLHLEETIAWCVRERIAILDLGVGDELYKLRIANARLPLFRGEYAATLAGRAYLAALAARHKLSAGPLGEAWRAYNEARIRRPRA